MWPFKSKPRQTFKEYAAAQKPAPCGDQLGHYYWNSNGWTCPVCTRIAKRKAEEAEQDALAKKVAAELFRLMNEKD